MTYLLGPTASVVSGQLAAVAAAPGHDVTLDCELRDTQGEGAEGANPAGQPSIRSCASVLNVVSNVQLSTSEVVRLGVLTCEQRNVVRRCNTVHRGYPPG